jgi:hypothetical protein
MCVCKYVLYVFYVCMYVWYVLYVCVYCMYCMCVCEYVCIYLLYCNVCLYFMYVCMYVVTTEICTVSSDNEYYGYSSNVSNLFSADAYFESQPLH